MTDFGPEDERLEGIYERMEELDPAKFEVDAAKLLHGLGFDKAMMAKGTKDMSGRSPFSQQMLLNRSNAPKLEQHHGHTFSNGM